MNRYLFVSALFLSCSPNAGERAKNAIDLAGYQQALDACREKGKAAKDYAVYEQCAGEADRKHGKDAGQ